MHRSLFLIVLCALASTSFAQEMFRYIDKDGRVVYSDAAPPPDASKVQRKRLGGNYIDTSEQPYAYQIAQQRNPVTLYSGACGATCDTARALLNRAAFRFAKSIRRNRAKPRR